mmetsp:Transcript_33606/g.60686  ORF Transcript_33606/g.60686 Transcript_33606/m.60686 type:complete len:287 (+) Transcript_33606:410-1270(+)
MDSALFLASIKSRFFLSSAAWASASFTMRSTSDLSRVEAPVMRMSWCLPVVFSVALTVRIPLASMENSTLIWGMPRGIMGMFSKVTLPRTLLSLANWRSPWRTRTSTTVWESAAVVKVSSLVMGRELLRGMRVVMTPPSVSTPSDSGVTSIKTMSLTSPLSTPACTAAPRATTSSGLTVRLGLRPPVIFSTSCCTAGIRVLPPTMTTSLMSEICSFASRSACSTGLRQRWRSSAHISSNLARVMVMSICLGPLASAVMKGRLMEACVALESSILAFSAASVRRCRA